MPGKEARALPHVQARPSASPLVLHSSYVDGAVLTCLDPFIFPLFFIFLEVGLSLGFSDLTGGDMMENEDVIIIFMHIHNGRSNECHPACRA